jgi:peptidoglycan/xylan/chitin deacetylase (PgdA/CDA1 family)
MAPPRSLLRQGPDARVDPVCVPEPLLAELSDPPDTPTGWRARACRVPILMYHRLTSRTGAHPYSLRIERFRLQLSLLRALGYRSISPIQIADAMLRGTPVPSRSVVITLDDGYLDTVVAALPLLLEFGFSATCYLVADRVGGSSDWTIPARLMGWQEAREWLAAGMAIGSHALTHHNLTTLPPNELLTEVSVSKARLEQKLGIAVESLAYPFNRLGPREMRAVEVAGYRAACAGPELRNSVFALTRLNIASDSLSWFLLKMVPLYPEARHLLLELAPFLRASSEDDRAEH